LLCRLHQGAQLLASQVSPKLADGIQGALVVQTFHETFDASIGTGAGEFQSTFYGGLVIRVHSVHLRQLRDATAVAHCRALSRLFLYGNKDA
jgi:hypothetical protein